MPPARSFDEAWSQLTTIIELAKRLRFVLVGCESEGVRAALRERLRAHCAAEGRPFEAPTRSQDALGWLIQQQRAGAESLAGRRPHLPPVRFFPVPAVEGQTFTLYRLNENRDNLRRDLRGMLVLAGLADFLRRVAEDAPDLWSMREETFEITEEDLQPIAERAPPEAPWCAPLFDAFLSYAYGDRDAANKLAGRLQKDRVGVFQADPSAPPSSEALTQSRFFVPLLSQEYVDLQWQAVERALLELYDARTLAQKTLPLMLRTTVAPGYLHQFKPLDWTTTSSRRQAYPELLRVLLRRSGHLAVRLDSDTIARIDLLLPHYALPGRRATRNDGLRAVILAGLDAEERRAAGQHAGTLSPPQEQGPAATIDSIVSAGAAAPAAASRDSHKEHVAVRLDNPTMARLGGLLPLYALQGRAATPGDGLRAVILAGLEAEERRP